MCIIICSWAPLHAYIGMIMLIYPLVRSSAGWHWDLHHCDWSTIMHHGDGDEIAGGDAPSNNSNSDKGAGEALQLSSYQYNCTSTNTTSSGHSGVREYQSLHTALTKRRGSGSRSINTSSSPLGGGSTTTVFSPRSLSSSRFVAHPPTDPFPTTTSSTMINGTNGNGNGSMHDKQTVPLLLSVQQSSSNALPVLTSTPGKHTTQRVLINQLTYTKSIGKFSDDDDSLLAGPPPRVHLQQAPEAFGIYPACAFDNEWTSERASEWW